MTTTRSNTDKTKRFAAIPVSPSPDAHTTQLTLEDFRKGMNEFESSIYKKLETENSEMKKSLEFISSKYDDLIKTIEMVLTNNKKLEDKIETMESTITNLQSRIQSLEIDAEHKNREANLKCLEFRGIPENQGESPEILKDIIYNISKTTNCSLGSKDIEEIYRVTRREKHTQPKDNKPRTVIVKLTSVTHKENLHSAIKKFNHCENIEDKMNTSVIGMSGPKNPIYVSELLTFQAKRLWFLARQLARERSYRYVWIKAGRIFVKKDENSRPILIDSEQKLTDIK